MKKNFYILIIVITSCKEAYNPPLKAVNTNYLVVEGNIIAGNDSTIIHLSRTTAINDTNGINKPETNASISVESEDGESYALQNESNGFYGAAPLNINPNKNYRLHIFTADGKEYASDYVPVKLTPPIDSVSWKFDSTGNINIYVNTHDAKNITKYYRWDFTETWEHRSVDSSVLIYDNGLRFRLPSEQIYRCWNIIPSSEIFIGSSTALSSDIIFEKKLIHIPFRSLKVRYYYSVLVKQYALTSEAFEFWQNLKKNSEQIGSLFDPQPFAEFGNIHCLSNHEETVLGFISACTKQQQRLYIEYSQVHYPYDLSDCVPISVAPSQIDEFFSLYTNLPDVYLDRGYVKGYMPECLDCSIQGGTTIKPPYMPR